MNAFQATLQRLPKIRENLGDEQADKYFVELILLAEELVSEMEGVRCPASAEAIISWFHTITNEIEVAK